MPLVAMVMPAFFLLSAYFLTAMPDTDDGLVRLTCGYIPEYLCDVVARACTRAEVVHSQFASVVLSGLELDLPIIFQVALITHDNNGQVRSTLAAQLLHPIAHFLVGVHICYIVHNQSA